MFDFMFEAMGAMNQAGALLAAFFCLAIGGLLLGNDLYWRLHGTQVQGTIAGVRATERGMFYPVYRYLFDGQMREATSNTGSNGTRGKETGREVSLLVFSTSPDEARETGGYAMPVVGIFFMLAGAAVAYFALTAWPIKLSTWIMMALMIAYGAAKFRRFVIPKEQREVSPEAWHAKRIEARREKFAAIPIRPVEEILQSAATDQQRKMPKTLAPILMVVGVGAIAFAIHLGNNVSRLQASGLRADGTVIRLEEETDDDSSTYHAVVSFAAAGAQEITFKDRVGTNPPSHHSGDAVRVLYMPGNPQSTATIDRGKWNWLPCVLLGAFGALLLACSVSLLRAARGQA